MAVVATDNFTGAADDQLANRANWSISTGNLDTLSASADVANNDNTGNENNNFWDGDTFDDDQYSQGVMAGAGGSNFIGICIRAISNNCYSFYAGGDSNYLADVIGGNWTQIGFTTDPGVPSDVIYLQAEGTTLIAKIDGATIHTLTGEDSLSSGSAGLSGWCGGTDVDQRIDNWEGGNLAAAAADERPGHPIRPIQRISFPISSM
jgi:hypothetical protein